MPINKQITQSQRDLVIVNEKISKDCSCSENFFDRKLVTTCITSALIAGVGVFSAIKLGMNTTENELKIISKNYEMLNEKVKNVKNLVSSLESSLSSATSEIKSSQNNFAYIYSKIASLQKDITSIKEKFHMDDATHGDDLQNMSASQISFIESLETLAKEGAPLGEFLKSYNGKFDVTTYVSGKNLLKFVDLKILSIEELQKIFANIGQSEFGISLNETFWEKQKRIIKEKFVNAITIKKNGKEDSQATNSSEDNQSQEKFDDKALFAQASESIKAGKIEQAVEILTKIKTEHPDITKFVSQAKQRISLDKAFVAFRKEFISVSSDAFKKNN